ncbi:NAD(P)/FAD-dependent oxidoreductase [Nucisporomicrobium flavum]|uniref:NAD(P)/FAD-dependent oxidoreductase n=1 Tax=Nucisporomicrobium flavum TaxID=2785915 RepID=UPI0018F77BDD|nr:hypothetical protein [Nucisporomicrobium flavum]
MRLDNRGSDAAPPTDHPTAHFDAVVVGAGPGGLFAALRALSGGFRKILIVDAGDDVAERLRARQDRPDDSQVITTGFGGAGLFSDGKLCLSHRIGSTIAHRFPAAQVLERQRAIDEQIRSGDAAPLLGSDAAAADLQRRANRAGMEYLHYPIRHVGSDQLPGMLRRLRATLAARADIRCRTRVVGVRPSGRPGARWTLQLQSDRGVDKVSTDHVVLAPGKVGAAWLDALGTQLGLSRIAAQPKLGFRLEGPKDFLQPLLAAAGDPKLIWNAGGGAEVRTHCVCFGGDVVPARYDGLLLVGGHATSSHDANRSNTAVIATAGTALPLTAADARGIVAGINERHRGVLAQRLGDFLEDSPSTQSPGSAARLFAPSMPTASGGDLGTEFPAAIVALLREYLHKLVKLCPQALHPDNQLYGPAVERWATRFAVSNEMEAEQPGLFLVGDGPGLTGGIIGAADSGWLAGDAIAARYATTSS